MDHSMDIVYEKFTDPQRVGPGVWYSFLLNASMASTEKESLYVCRQIRDFCDHFGCGMCSSDCKKYIEDRAPENYVGRHRGLFKWVVKFMNKVQVKTGKPIYPYENVERMFYDEDIPVCTDCGDKHSTNQSFDLYVPKYYKDRADRLLHPYLY